MDADVQTWIWLGGGLVLLASEFVTPSLVVGFLGAGALTVAGLRGVDVIDGTAASMAVWAVSSGLYLALMRHKLEKWFGKGETTRQSTSDELRAFGALVEVVEAVGEDVPGRIRYEGTTWKAHTLGGSIPAGAKAKLLHRDNIGWVVEPADKVGLSVVGSEAAVVPARVKDKA